MKLLRYGAPGQEKPGMLDADGQVRDLTGHVEDLGGDTLSLTALDRLRNIDPATLPLVAHPGRIGCALAWVPNFHAVGLNYVKHAAESGMAAPAEPVIFSKATGCLSGPHDPIRTPRGSTKLDWEVELGVVIGREALYVSEAEALDYVAAYCTVNDVSERAFQIERSGQWVKGKSAPTFGPVGPWLVTADEVGDPQTLRVSTHVNGAVTQDSNTSDMIFTIAQIVSHLSQFMALRPGDLICTGTPEGVGMGMKPPQYLQPGDVVEVEVHGLGRQRQEVLAAS
jgi:2-keto-4-pentenoate hydratase/2-oxohepta-3-ene-1,7-dioic acid hydratase in catechol pathway